MELVTKLSINFYILLIFLFNVKFFEYNYFKILNQSRKNLVNVYQKLRKKNLIKFFIMKKISPINKKLQKKI